MLELPNAATLGILLLWPVLVYLLLDTWNRPQQARIDERLNLDRHYLWCLGQLNSEHTFARLCRLISLGTLARNDPADFSERVIAVMQALRLSYNDSTEEGIRAQAIIDALRIELAA